MSLFNIVFQKVNRFLQYVSILSVSFFWSFVNLFIRCIYFCGLRRQTRFPVRVISVGNVEVGGTGKTPLVVDIARRALQRGVVPIILTRGYGGRWVTAGGVLGIKTKTVSARDCGDEPALMAQQIPSAILGIGRDRKKSFSRIMKELEETKDPRRPGLVILDDGLQQFSIHRDLNLVTFTGKRRAQKVFREFVGPWLKLDAVVKTRKVEEPILSPYFKTLPNFVMERELFPKADSLRPQRVMMVCAVGDPKTFRVDLENSGFFVAEERIFKDHYAYPTEELKELLRSAKLLGLKIATTRKDFVKWDLSSEDEAHVLVFDQRVKVFLKEEYQRNSEINSLKEEESWESFLFPSSS